MKKLHWVKFLLICALVISFITPARAFALDPGKFKLITPDDLAIEEENARLEAERNAARASGVFGPMASNPQYPFSSVNSDLSNGRQWPPSMQRAFQNSIPGVAAWLKTPAFLYESEGGRHKPEEDQPGKRGFFTTNDEIENWFEKLQNIPNSRVKYKLITGFPFYASDDNGTDGYQYQLVITFPVVLAVISKPSVFTPEEVKALGKPVIWVRGSIHGGESSPAEANLQIAKEFAEGKHDDILDKVTLVMVARMNVDGAYYHTRGTSATAPVGHAGQGQNGVDMNRDYVGYETPLVRAMRQIHMAYNPVASIDGHEMGFTVENERTDENPNSNTGYVRGYEPAIVTSVTPNLNVDAAVRKLGDDIIEQAVKKTMEEKKLGWRWYPNSVTSQFGLSATVLRDGALGTVISGDIDTGTPVPGFTQYAATLVSDYHQVPEEGISINGIALGNQSVVLCHEATSVGGNTSRLGYLRRVYAHYLAAMAFIQSVADNADLFRDTVAAAQAKEIARSEPLSFWGKIDYLDNPKDEVRAVLEYADWRKTDSDDVVNSVRWVDRPIKGFRYQDAYRDPIATVTRPVAYIIPPEYYEAAMRLYYTGAKLQRLVEETTLEVEASTVTETGYQHQSPSLLGTAPPLLYQVITGVTQTTKQVTFPKDSFVVPMNQLGASIVGLSLEPRAIRNYGNFYLSRTPGVGETNADRTNTNRIPAWYRDTFLPAKVGDEFPAYRYMKSEPLKTYSANMNMPFMLTMVTKVHSPTMEEVKKMLSALGAENASEPFISVLEFPAHSALREFLLPNGEHVTIAGKHISDTRKTIIVAPAGLEKGAIYLAKDDGKYEFELVREGTSNFREKVDEFLGGCNAISYVCFAFILLLGAVPIVHRRKYRK